MTTRLTNMVGPTSDNHGTIFVEVEIMLRSIVSAVQVVGCSWVLSSHRVDLFHPRSDIFALASLPGKLFIRVENLAQLFV